jgi:hypothetical protein
MAVMSANELVAALELAADQSQVAMIRKRVAEHEPVIGMRMRVLFDLAKQGTELTAFINKFLLQSGSGTTNIFRTEKNHGSFNLDTWAGWSVPTLS